MMDREPTVTPDPRPRVETVSGSAAVVGVRCGTCAYPTFASLTRCPVCGADTESSRFAPTGTVFASTCVRVRVPDRPSPRGLAYVDLRDGPRVLVETPIDESPVQVGASVTITGVNGFGDLQGSVDS